jgi:hypothetical protein
VPANIYFLTSTKFWFLFPTPSIKLKLGLQIGGSSSSCIEDRNRICGGPWQDCQSAWGSGFVSRLSCYPVQLSGGLNWSILFGCSSPLVWVLTLDQCSFGDFKKKM